ncbi:unnamed protein product [Adineta steineri]|uniref:G-protein coupled receptors family 1 profile domain-containing protein n=1 Tax=Adineta steineri TaxID=433720 RepID=A0A814I547_9BILA|nr:unnamed protein product [Adineta steineri]CAF1365444.1 unnamed protein product [Adineta steineri]CAF3706064.1 unnamed protein product [Adineta steineri]CAF4043959.1 unnamed protein product [Adineta steineri]
MDSNDDNVTRGLVRAILTFTEEQRNLSNVQSVCQFIYCKFSMNDQDDNNETCYVSTTKLSFSHDTDINDNLYFISIAKCIQLYIYPIFIFLGIFGNSLSCFIMFLNVRRNGYSANFYLTILAFVDCLFLLGSALPNWISRINNKLDIKLFSDLCCRFVYWFGHFTTHLSAGLVVSVTVERFIAVQYPLRAPKINSVSHTHMVLIVLITFFFLLDSRVFILVKYFNEHIHIVSTCPNDTKYERHDILRCDVTDEQNEQTWVFIDSAVYTLIPFFIIVTLNSLIIYRLIQAQRLRQSMSYFNGKSLKYGYENLRQNMSDDHPSINNKYKYLRRSRSVPIKTSTSSKLHPRTSERSKHLSTKTLDLSPTPSLELQHRPDHHYESCLIRQTTHINNKRLTILLLYVSFSFLTLTFPAVVLNLIISIKPKPQSLTFQNYPSVTNYNLDSNTILYYSITRLLMIMNHSVNFILYFVVGKRFRRDLKRICCGY